VSHAEQLRDLADIVEVVEAGPADLLNADLRHDDQEEPVAELTVEVPLPLDGVAKAPDQDVETVDDGDTDEIPVGGLTEVSDGIGESIITRLEEAGHETIADLEDTTTVELEAIPQLGPKTVEQVTSAIAELREDAPPTEDPEPPAWTPDSNTGGTIVPTRRGQETTGEKP